MRAESPHEQQILDGMHDVLSRRGFEVRPDGEHVDSYEDADGRKVTLAHSGSVHDPIVALVGDLAQFPDRAWNAKGLAVLLDR